LDPITRLSVAEAADGWMNFVTSPEPIEKSLQFMIARLDAWVTTTVAGLEAVMVADPAATTPPVGFARTTSGATTPATSSVRHAMMDRMVRGDCLGEWMLKMMGFAANKNSGKIALTSTCLLT
jgi:hypothetical protein